MIVAIDAPNHIPDSLVRAIFPSEFEADVASHTTMKVAGKLPSIIKPGLKWTS